MSQILVEGIIERNEPEAPYSMGAMAGHKVSAQEEMLLRLQDRIGRKGFS